MADLRIGDREREDAVRLLGDQYAEGRLTKEEFDERSDAVWSARTRSDLAPAFADLPVRPRRRGGVSGRPAGVRQQGRTRRVGPFPLVPLLFVLVGIALLLKAPFLILVLVVWVFCVRGWWRRRW